MKKICRLKYMKTLFILFVIILNINLIYAEQNLTDEQKANLCLKDSKQILIDMQNEDYSIQRVNDSLKQLENLYNSQLILKEKDKNYDFSLVIPYCEEIAKIQENALKSRDSLIALKKFYKEFSEPGMNTSSVDILINEIERELKNERYEKIPSLIDKAYQQITNIQSSYSTLKVFYETTTASMGKFIYKNKYYILGTIVILIILFFVYKRTIFRWNIKRKIKNLELRKNTLKQMIMNTQKSYFERGEISEGIFNIKTQKLAELIRDIDRQIPLLQEEFVKLNQKDIKK